MTTVSLALFAGIQADSTTASLIPAFVIAGFGAGLMMVPATEAIVGSAPEDKAGVASGVQQSMQQLGSTLGIAVFGAILGQYVAGNFATRLTDALGQGNPAVTQLAEDSTIRQAVALGFPSSVQDALGAKLPAELVSEITRAAHETFIGGLHVVFLVAASVTVVAGILALFIRQTQPTKEAGEEATTMA